MSDRSTTINVEFQTTLYELTIDDQARLQDAWSNYRKDRRFGQVWARALEATSGQQEMAELVNTCISGAFADARRVLAGLWMSQQLSDIWPSKDVELLAGPWTLAWTRPPAAERD